MDTGDRKPGSQRPPRTRTNRLRFGPEVVKSLLLWVAAGHSRNAWARAVKLNPGSVKRWVRRAKAERAAGLSTAYTRFLTKLEEAEAAYRAGLSERRARRQMRPSPPTTAASGNGVIPSEGNTMAPDDWDEDFDDEDSDLDSDLDLEDEDEDEDDSDFDDKDSDWENIEAHTMRDELPRRNICDNGPLERLAAKVAKLEEAAGLTPISTTPATPEAWLKSLQERIAMLEARKNSSATGHLVSGTHQADHGMGSEHSPESS